MQLKTPSVDVPKPVQRKELAGEQVAKPFAHLQRL